MPRRGSSRARRMPCPRGSPAGSCPGSRPRLASASPHREPGVIDGFRVHTLYPGGAAGGGERDKVGGGYAASATGSGAWTGTWCVVLGCTPKRHTRQSQPRATGEPEPPPPICPALRFWQRWDAATLTGPGAELLAVELATLVSGTAGTIVICRGYLWAARCCLVYWVSSAAVTSAPGRGDTNGTTSSPSRASGRPTTPAWATAGWATSTSSTSRG